MKSVVITRYKCVFNPYHAEFLKWNNPPSIYGTFHYQFKGYQDENLMLVSPGQTARMQSGLALYWWQRLITLGIDRIRVNVHFL